MPSKRNLRRLKQHARRRRRLPRVSRFEALEPRRLLAPAVWNNVSQPLNVSGDADGYVSPIDALFVIEELNNPTLTDPVTGLLPRQTETPQNGPYVDVSCDGYVSALDALLVVEGLNKGDRGDGQYDGTGTWRDVSCSPQLLEADDFVTQLTRRVILPDNRSALQVKFQRPQFDTSSTGAVRDAWEIEVRRDDGTPLVQPYTYGADAVVNWSEGLSGMLGSAVEWDLQPAGEDSTATINLAGIPGGTAVDVTVRLVNNDTDQTTSALIRGFEFVSVAGVAPPAVLQNTSPTFDPTIDVASLSDITGLIEPAYGRTELNGEDDQLEAGIVMTNVGNRTIRSPLVVVPRHFTSIDVSAFRPDGFLPDGAPYFVFAPENRDEPLLPGASTAARQIAFLNPSNDRFGYEFQVLGRLNATPSRFDTEPLTEIEAGKQYVYASQAVDVDDSRLVYELLTRPDGMQVDADTGVVSWQTQTGDVGAHRVVLRATDPYGQSVEQDFVVHVRESLQNRPPIFVTDPVTEAIASSGFEIDTLASGTGPVGVSVVEGPLGPRIVSLNQDTSSLSVIERSPNAIWESPQEVPTGDPPSGDAIFDMGFAIDIGMEPWTHSDDANAVHGMDQGDFNGDGVLDLAVLTRQYHAEMRSDRYQITVTLGDGNGGFGEPNVIADWPTRYQDGRNVVVADVTGDGNADVLAVERTAKQLVFVSGNGDGTFADASIVDLDYNLSDFRVADVDEDGQADLIGRTAVLGFGATYTLVWLRGNGDGTFGAPQTIGPGGAGPLSGYQQRTRAFAIGDFNRDGHIDVTTGGYESGIQVYHGDGTGNFTQVFSVDPSGRAFANGPDWMEAADFTGDGYLDIAFYHTVEHRTNLLVGDETGAQFVEQINPVTGPVANYAAGPSVVDIDHDGDLDIVAASGTVRILQNDGSGAFSVTDYEMVDFPGQLSDHFSKDDDAATGAMFGDYNQDGVIDLAYMTEGQDFNSVGIRLGTRPGEFGASRTIPGQLPNEQDTLPADFNGDGIIDLLAIRSATISLGLGDGTFDDAFAAFSVRRPYGSGSVADFNLDGLPDFVASAENRYFIGLSNGDGTFTISDDQVVEGSVYGISATDVADFNADGFPDFIAKAGIERTIDVYLNQGAASPGTFVRSYRTTITAQGVNVQGFDQAFAVGDFNGDSILDFVAADQLTDEPMKLVLYAGDGIGGFSPIRDSFVYDDDGLAGVIYSGDLSAGDLNEDGVLDVVSFTNSGARVHLGIGDGSFVTTDHYLGTPYLQRGRDGYVVDIDADGHLDLVQAVPFTAGMARGSTLQVRRGLGDGTFQPPQKVGLLGTTVAKLHFADLDHDGHLDVVHPTNLEPPSTAIYAGARDGLVDVVTDDLNGDGFEDVLAINEQYDRVKIFLGDALGRLTRQPDLLTGRAPRALTTADLDGDGTPEIITANRAGRSLTIFSAAGDNHYSSSEVLAGNGFIDVAAADLDSDGHIDLLALDDTSHALWVWRGNGTRTPESPFAVPLGDVPGRMDVADVDADGILDVAVTLPESQRLMVLPGDGTAQFMTPYYVDTPSAPHDVAVADLNADGLPDLIATLPDGGQVSIHYNSGHDQFARPQLIRVGADPRQIQLSDVDEDGRVDVVVANRGDDTVSVIYNRFDPNEVYRYDADAVDPDGDPLTYRIEDGPGGLLIDAATGRLLWAASPNQVGTHAVTIAADDGLGGTATQSFTIDVRPARENALPFFASDPPAVIGAADVLSFRSEAVDTDGDALRYRLIDGPPGATIDPTTGTLRWDGRSRAMQFGRGGEGSDIRVPPDASLKPDSITIEGWFNLFRLNRFEELIHDRDADRYLVARDEDNRALRVELKFADSADNLRFFANVDPEVDRWYHIALTYDANTGTASLYVDGELAASATTRPQPLALNPDGLTYVAQNTGASGTQASIENYRIWNYARSASEIREGLARQYENDPRLVLDYRFDGPDTVTVRDHSIYGNTGYRVSNGQIPTQTAGLTDSGSHPFTIRVEDGRGGTDERSFDVEVAPEIRATILGRLFDDLNGDGKRDDGSQEGTPAEPPLAGWLVYIDENRNRFYDNDERATTSDSDGVFRFDGLLPGTYPVEIDSPAGYHTPPTQELEALPSIVGELDPQAQMAHEIAIGQLAKSHIKGALRTQDGGPIRGWSAYVDLDGDGQRDSDELSSRSDSSGNYIIGGLTAGNYTVRVDLPPGWAVANGSNEREVTVGSDEVVEGIDFTARATNTSTADGIRFFTTPIAFTTARDAYRYEAVARAITGAEVSYDLSLAPEGMVVDAREGVVSWKPTVAQVGSHRVVLRASTSAGSIALQEFTVEVNAPNTSPVIVALDDELLPRGDAPVTSTAYVGRLYSVQIGTQDADSDNVTLAIAAGPAGLQIDPQSGQLTWLPEPGDEGIHDVTLEASDPSGHRVERHLRIDVQASAPPATPIVVDDLRSQVGVGQQLLTQLRGSDPLGRRVQWSLVQGPSAMTVESDGTVRWTPSGSELGEQPATFQWLTADGESGNFDFVWNVVGRSINSAPAITSVASEAAVVGQPYAYNVDASDADKDLLAFQLLSGPIGMSLHPSLGTLRWTPEADQLGDHEVIVQVTDPEGTTDVQSFDVRVTVNGTPPRILSTAETEASVGTGYLYPVTAVDREGDPLRYRLLAAPTGMTIVEGTGVVSWTPTATQVGLHDVVVEVADGVGGAATQAFRILVADGVANLPPEIRSTAPRFASVGVIYRYQLDAVDPENQSITYSLGQAPANMQIDANTGEVSWDPQPQDVGKQVVTLIATDSLGASAIESFELDVIAANRNPVIQSEAPSEALIGASYRYQILAKDDDADRLSFELLSGPTGVELDVFGQLTWTPTADQLGRHDFVVAVSDPRSGVAQQSFQVDVVEDTTPPLVSLIERPNDANRNIQPWAGPFRVYAKAIDNVEVASLTLTANGKDIPLDAMGSAVFTFEEWKFARIRATATAVDTSGNMASRTITFDYDFPEGWSGAGTEEIPEALIDSPTESESVSGLVSITGTASHAAFDSYKLSYRRADETDFTEISTSRQAVRNGELGVWDTTLLENDEYVLRLEVATTGGVVNVAERHVGLSGALKLGNFRLSFTDLTIPISGIPIEFTRVYDSLRADRSGDFGFGWRLEYRDTDLRVGLPESGLEDIGIYTPMRPGVKIYLNVPGEGRQGFTFAPEIRVLPGWGGNNLVLARPRFQPDPGVTSQLSAGTSHYLHVNEQGELYAPGGIPYHPAAPDFGGAFEVTTAEGIVYKISGASGKLDSARDRNGNVVIFSDDSVRAGDLTVKIARDSAGRIVAITDLLDRATRFEYDTTGDLTAVRDREGNRTQFVYRTDPPHYLSEVIDPLGRTGTRGEYDETGRLIATVDVFGNRSEVAYDLDNQLAITRDRLGNVSISEYDQLGNIVRFTDPLGRTTVRDFDAAGRLVSVTDPLGGSTQWQRDKQGNATKIIRADGSTVLQTFDRQGRMISRTDPRGFSERFEYDDAGNLVRVIDARGATRTMKYDASGNLTQTVDAEGRTTTASYDRFGNAVETIDPLGHRRTYGFDGNGRQISNQTTVMRHGVPTTLTAQFSLDAEGRLLANTDAEGFTYTQTFDALGRVASVKDQAGRQFTFEGLDHDVPEQLQGPDGSSASYEFDAEGRVVGIVTQNGVRERYVYDAAGNVVERILPDETPDSDTDNPRFLYSYDPLDRLIVTRDPTGAETRYTYDTVGNTIAVRDASGNKTTRTFDAAGNVTSITDPLGRTTRYAYDEVGNLTDVTLPNHSQVHYDYDLLGNRIRIVAPDGTETLFAYDDASRLTMVTDATGFQWQYGYDEVGNLTSITDALGNTTRYEYDGRAQRTKVILPDGSESTTTYNADLTIASETDFGGATTRYEYDDGRRVTKVTFADGSTQEFTHDAMGHRLSATVDGKQTIYAYDAMGRLVRRVDPDTGETSWTYDGMGRPTSVTTPDGVTRYEYTPTGDLAKVIDSANRETLYEYDAARRLVRTLMPNGIRETRSYDSVDQLISVESFTSDGTKVLDYTYQYDVRGNLIEAGERSGRVRRFAYDPNQRLVRESVWDGGSLMSKTVYTYDAVGNRTDKIVGNDHWHYSYDMNHQLLSIASDGGTTTFEYDANGRRVRKTQGDGSSTSYQWNALGQLVRVQSPQTLVEYSYDVDGNIVRRMEGGQETRMRIDPSGALPRVIDEYRTDGTETVRYTYGVHAISQDRNGQLTFYHTARDASVIALSDASANIAVRYDADAFGNFDTSEQGPANPLHFLGERWDTQTELTFLRARHLDNSTGRFLGRDPAEPVLLEPLSAHPYLYARSNPNAFQDPSGRSFLAEITVAQQIRLGLLGGLFLLFQQQLHSRLAPLTWKGFTASFQESSPTKLSGVAQSGNFVLGDVGFSAGPGVALTGVVSSKFTQSGENRQHHHVGSLATLFAGISAGISAGGGIGIGGIEVESPNLQRLKDLGHVALAGGYALVGLDVGFVAGLSFGTYLFMGTARGSANGLSLSPALRLQGTFLVGVSIPLFGSEVSESTARHLETLLSYGDPLTYIKAIRSLSS